MPDFTTLMKMFSVEISSQMKIRTGKGKFTGIPENHRKADHVAADELADGSMADTGFDYKRRPTAKTAMEENPEEEHYDASIEDEGVSEDMDTENSDMTAASEKTSLGNMDWQTMILEPERLQQAVLWSEILGEPVARKRRRERRQVRRGN